MTTLHQHFNITIVRSSSPMSILHTPSENPLVLEDISSDQLLEQLDHCVRQAFCAVTLHDWIQMFDVMEAQIGDVYAWLPARKPSRTSRMSASLGLTDTQEDIVISDIYTAIEGARRSVVSPSAFSDDDLLLAFPHSIQYLYSLHYVMRYWVIQALASPKMDVKTRVLRIEKFLQVILTPQRKIPGFVEYAIASALVSPEVRLFSKAWNDVAVQHGNASLDTLQHLLAQIQKMQPILNESKAVVPSLGWILERVLELKTHQADMIHFEKRHYTVDFIHWLMGLQIELASNTPTTLSFQLMLTNEVWTWKEMRDLANKENKRNVRQRMVFHKLVLDQMDKMKRDQKERDRIDKEWTSFQHKMQKKQVEQQIRLIPRWNSFLKGFRDVKTSTVISLIGASTFVQQGSKRDFVFRIVTEEGGQYLLQGMSRDDMQDWMRHINAASKEGAAKRQSVLVSEYVAENLSQTNRHGQQVQEAGGVYGVALDVMMQDGSVPAVVEKCICEIEKRGLEEVGIYRVAGTGSVVTSLKHAFNKGVSKVDLGDASWADINVVADAFKQFLRELPEPLLTYTYYNEFIHTSTLEDHDERVYLLKQIVKKLPLPNYTLLKRIIEHFVIVTDFESTNHMYATNLAIVFGPTLLQPSPSPSSFITTMSNLAHHQNIVKYLVLNYHYLFDVENDDVVAGPQ
ncbi:RhoGAP-domain-containing protein [Backusella circina FSU 941]|nr:RhoGAP-domain-containing protein [Backusella circina FSU 941]